MIESAYAAIIGYGRPSGSISPKNLDKLKSNIRSSKLVNHNPHFQKKFKALIDNQKTRSNQAKESYRKLKKIKSSEIVSSSYHSKSSNKLHAQVHSTDRTIEVRNQGEVAKIIYQLEGKT